jgi:hypothetical protein
VFRDPRNGAMSGILRFRCAEREAAGKLISGSGLKDDQRSIDDANLMFDRLSAKYKFSTRFICPSLVLAASRCPGRNLVSKDRNTQDQEIITAAMSQSC